MNVETRNRDGVRIVDVSGDVDLKWSPVLRKELFAAFKDAPKVALNLAAIRYIDSSGIGVLIISTQNLQKCGGSLALVNASEDVRKVFMLTGLENFFVFFKNEKDALAAF